MAKKSNYVFPIEKNTALEVIKIIKNFYLLEGATGEELLEKRSGPSTKLLLGGLAEEAITQDLLNNVYANFNNEEALIDLIKERFQSINYENALYILRWSKDSQSPYYPRMQGDKPVEQFFEDYELAKNLLVAYINDHGVTAIKNLPGRVVKEQKEIIKEMANGFRSLAISQARQVLTTNQEALVELRNSIKEQKQKIADLKAANPDAQTSELEAKLKEDRLLAMDRYQIVKGQRRSLRDTLEERAILDRDLAQVVGGKTTLKAQYEAEDEDFDEKFSLERRVLEILKKSPAALQNPSYAVEVVARNIRGKYNNAEVSQMLGEPTEETTYQPQYSQESTEEVQSVENQEQQINEEESAEILDNQTTEEQPEVEAVENTPETVITEEQPAATVENSNPEVNNNVNYADVNSTVVQPNNAEIPAQPVTNAVNANSDADAVTNAGGDDNGQQMFNNIYNQAMQESIAEPAAQPQAPTPNVQPQFNNVNNNTDVNNTNV